MNIKKQNFRNIFFKLRDNLKCVDCDETKDDMEHILFGVVDREGSAGCWM